MTHSLGKNVSLLSFWTFHMGKVIHFSCFFQFSHKLSGWVFIWTSVAGSTLAIKSFFFFVKDRDSVRIIMIYRLKFHIRGGNIYHLKKKKSLRIKNECNEFSSSPINLPSHLCLECKGYAYYLCFCMYLFILWLLICHFSLT